jgi:hypothetical protein
MMQAPVENPFNFKEPVRDPAFFFGRRDEVRRILDFLRISQCVSLVGPARIGKTSLLNYVSHPRVLSEHGLDESEWLFAYVDCRELADKDREQVFDYIGTQIKQQVTPPDSVTAGHVTCLANLEDICGDLDPSGSKLLVIVLDTFESLIRNEQFDPNLSVNLRSLNTNFDVAFLTASEEPLHDLERRHFDDMTDTSPFSNIFTLVPLRPLDEGESRALLKHYFALAGLTLPDQDVGGVVPRVPQPGGKTPIGFFRSVFSTLRDHWERFRRSPSSDIAGSLDSIVALVVEKAAGHPYCLQWAGWHAVDLWHRNAGKWNDTCRDELLKCLRNLPGV